MNEDTIEDAARQMHEFAQLDEGREEVWGEDGCTLCRLRVKMISRILNGETRFEG
jgi:hypothetical protein